MRRAMPGLDTGLWRPRQVIPTSGECDRKSRKCTPDEVSDARRLREFIGAASGGPESTDAIAGRKLPELPNGEVDTFSEVTDGVLKFVTNHRTIGTAEARLNRRAGGTV